MSTINREIKILQDTFVEFEKQPVTAGAILTLLKHRGYRLPPTIKSLSQMLHRSKHVRFVGRAHGIKQYVIPKYPRGN